MITPDEFRSELSNAYNDLATALVLTISDHDELFDEEGDLLPGAIDALLFFLPEAVKGIRAEDGKVSVDVAELKALFERLDDASGDVDDAFQTFDREVERVWRRFRQSLVCETVEG
jgi:hypothetical protein